MDEVAAARAASERFCAIYGATPPPLDVEDLAASLYKLRVRAASDLAAVPGAPAGVPLSGLLLPHLFEIWVRSDESETRRRFSIAHETGHWVLHVPAARAVFCRETDVRPDTARAGRLVERQANRFAAELLMPEAAVREEVARLGARPQALAARFQVSPIAMAYRLVNLGYLETPPPELERERRDPL